MPGHGVHQHQQQRLTRRLASRAAAATTVVAAGRRWIRSLQSRRQSRPSPMHLRAASAAAKHPPLLPALWPKLNSYFQLTLLPCLAASLPALLPAPATATGLPEISISIYCKVSAEAEKTRNHSGGGGGGGSIEVSLIERVQIMPNQTDVSKGCEVHLAQMSHVKKAPASSSSLACRR